MPATKTPSVSQLLVLATAARRPDRMVLPLPTGLRAHGAIQRQLLASLLKLGLVEERPTGDQARSWRRDEQGHGHALRITAAGLQAVGGAGAAGAGIDSAGRPAPAVPEPGAAGAQPAPDAPPPEHTGAPGTDGAPAPATTARAAMPDAPAGEPPASPLRPGASTAPAGAALRPGGKLGRILDAAAAAGGATPAELAALTGWRPHTTRAAVTRLRRRGFDLRIAVAEGRRAYRLLSAVQA